MKTTKRQFDLFRTEVKKWLDFFGLNHQWKVHIEMSKLRADDVAECMTNHSGKISSILLNSKYPKGDNTDDYIRRSAFHEVCELLISELNCLIFQRLNVNEKDVERAMHTVIRNLEHTIFDRTDKC